MATIFLDGSVCLNREGACYKYYAAIATRFSRWGHRVIITPGPEGVLENLAESGVEIVTRSVPKAPGWLPQGAWRRYLSGVRKMIENRRVKKQQLRRDTEAARMPGTKDHAVFFSFFYNLPSDLKTPSVCIVLDLIDELFPEMDSPETRKLKARRLAAMEHATKILCISETTKRDLIQRYPKMAEKAEAIYIGIDQKFFNERVPAVQAEKLLPTLGIQRPYFLHVGGRLNHKNFPLLAKAFAQGGFASEFDLVCTGDKFLPEETELFESLGIAQSVRHVHFPNESILRVLYQNAMLFAYPSKYEGFGLPPLEAMACNCPVVAARGGSIPEVSGPGAWLVSPEDPSEMAQAMRMMLRPAVAAEFRAKGGYHVRQFQWDPTARKILDLFLEAAGEIRNSRAS